MCFSSLCKSLLSGCFWSLLTGVTLGSTHRRRFTQVMTCNSPNGCWGSKVAERMSLPSIWVAGGDSPWPLEGDQTLIRQSAEVEADQSLHKPPRRPAGHAQEAAPLGFLAGSFDKTAQRGFSYRNKALRCCSAQGRTT